MPAKPLHSSKITKKQLETVKGLGEEGAVRMGLEPMPVQREIWNLLEARNSKDEPLHESSAIEVPRRSGKTEGLLALCVGRCATIPDYSCLYTAQSGTKSRERFYGLLRRMSRYDNNGDWRARESRGEERFEFTNGAIFRFAPPQASSFRGDAVDFWVADEAQEVDEEDSEDLIGSALPVFDTREGAQMVVAGTAGAIRAGLLWESLEKGRAGYWGILEYAAPEGMDPDDPKNWLKVHPGPAGVSAKKALEVLKKRHATMSPEMFGREYLGIWPDVTSHAAFSPEIWNALGRAMPQRPSRFVLSFDVSPTGQHASVVAVWRDAGGFLWAEVLADRNGSDWVAKFVVDLAMRYKAPVGHDTSGTETLRVADEIARLSKQRVSLIGLTTDQFAVACAAFNQEVINGTFRHARQEPLDNAVANAARRKIKDGGWAWGRVLSAGPISSVIAVSVGVKIYNDLPARRVLTPLSARSA